MSIVPINIVIARSGATRQSRAIVSNALDCFALLAMTNEDS
ncbi:hypothetical protein [Parasphingorhabdus halotolerans]|nr:hypothetical protein [Parasphingorhabdus halotolerans]